MSTKTAMDKKIDELNAKAGKATGIDFVGSAKAIGSEIYENKTYLTGVSTGLGLFVLTSTGLFASIGGAVIAGYIYNVYAKNKTEKTDKTNEA